MYTNFDVVLTTLLQFWLSLKQLPYPFLRTGNNLSSNIFTTGNFILCGTPEMGVGLGVFGLGAFIFLIPFHFWSEVVLQKKYVQIWPISFGKLPATLCHKPEPSRYQLQEKAGSSLSVTDSILNSLLFRPISSRCDVLVFRCELPVCWARRPLGRGPPTQLTDGSDLGH